MGLNKNDKTSKDGTAFTAEDAEGAEEKREPVTSKLKHYESPERPKTARDQLFGKRPVRVVFCFGFPLRPPRPPR